MGVMIFIVFPILEMFTSFMNLVTFEFEINENLNLDKELSKGK